jgi:hypothetical protein
VIRLFLAAASLSLAFAAPATAGEKAHSFTHEGVRYEYTSTKSDEGVVLEGYAKPVGGKFRLVVRNGRVTGYVGTARVSFLVRDAIQLRDKLEVASN